MEDLKCACKILNHNDFLCTIDLKNAFLSVRLGNKSRKYVKFTFNGLLYQFTSLPFGLSLSPLIFTKIMEPVILHLRSKGYWSNIHLDDALLYGVSQEDCLANVQITMNVLQNLGFIINFEKRN